MRPFIKVLTGFVSGAAGAYFTDPAAGRRRRAYVRDKAFHYYRFGGRQLRFALRDLVFRTYGQSHRIAQMMRDERVDDDILVERVRAKLGRLVRYPHGVEVAARDGAVILKGRAMEEEVWRLHSAVARVPGVRSVQSDLRRRRPLQLVA